jgi:deazaflavin-dependent oxidoreductase (nitroreductase family)
MTDGEYGPSTWGWVADQVEAYEASGGSEANTLRDTGIPIIVFTTKGHKSGKIRKVPLMRVEHEGAYALVASKGGDPKHPGWYHNLIADPEIMMQDGPEPYSTTARVVTGQERAQWWERAVAVFEPYAQYQVKAGDREIPVFVTNPK